MDRDDVGAGEEVLELANALEAQRFVDTVRKVRIIEDGVALGGKRC